MNTTTISLLLIQYMKVTHNAKYKLAIVYSEFEERKKKTCLDHTCIQTSVAPLSQASTARRDISSTDNLLKTPDIHNDEET